MNAAKASTILILLLLVTQFNVAAGGNFIIIRANVNPMYIEGESIFIQAFILVFRNNKPTDESATLHVEIAGKNVEYSYSEDFTIPGGRRESYYLPALAEGHYRITIFAQKGGLSSQKMAFEFGVSKAPVPYLIKFLDDGRKVYFKSLKLNETGQIDPNYPFIIKVWYSQYGEDMVPVKTITNVTEITITIPSSIQQSLGVVYVDVIDYYGWKNSATMDLSSFSFTGMPLAFNYGYKYMEPYRSRTWEEAIKAVLTIAFIIVILIIMAKYARRRRDMENE